eukprot:m.138355 g.138355  ORF g.138355 m.138355 type:complete len:286 (-) comp29985_c0_seq2:152-1009(-)
MNFTLPLLFLLGQQKAGSSSLWHVLINSGLTQGVAIDSEPEYAAKETHYFDVHWVKGVDWYRRHWPSSSNIASHSGIALDGKFYIEATPNYIHDEGVAKRIAQTYDDYGIDRSKLRFLVVVRSGADRLLSWYNHCAAYGKTSLEHYGGEKGFSTLFMGGLQHHNVTRMLEEYLIYFNSDQILVLEFSWLLHHSVAAVQTIMRHMIGKTQGRIIEFPHHNPLDTNGKLTLADLDCDLVRKLATHFDSESASLARLMDAHAWSAQQPTGALKFKSISTSHYAPKCFS